MSELRRAARAGGVLQLALVVAGSAAGFARTFPVVWHDSRPGCVVDELQPYWSGYDDRVICGSTSSSPALGWAAAAAGLVLVLVVARAAGRLRQVAQAGVLLVTTVGIAVFTADQARFGGVRAAICINDGRGGCSHPAWTWTSMLVGAAVGLALGLVSLLEEAVSREARLSPLGWRRVLRGALVVASVPTAVLALWARLQLGDMAESTPLWWGGAAAALLVAGLAVGPRSVGNPSLPASAGGR